MRCSSSERATMQLRRSPGGSMLKPRRRRPLEPPSSVTVTTAAKSAMRHGASSQSLEGWTGETTKRRNPRRRVERPVPPPMATARRLERSVLRRGAVIFFAGLGFARVGDSDFAIERSPGCYYEATPADDTRLFHEACAQPRTLRGWLQGTSGYSNSVKRGSSAIS
jgi:hypothetical protein